MSQLKIKDLESVICECGCKLFEQYSLIKRVSPLISGTGKEEMVNVPVYTCKDCGEVNVKFLPDELQDEFSKEDG